MRPGTQQTLVAVLLSSFAALASACSDGGTTPTDTAPVDPGPTEVIDLLPQTVHDPIDILFVLDGGWRDGLDGLDEQALDRGFQTLLLADPAWRVGILDATATGGSFGLMGPKFETWPYRTSVFQPKGTSSTPKFREAIFTALEMRRDQEANQGFLRSEGDLYILVFTDRADGTDDLDDGISQSAFEDWLEDFERSNSVRIGVFTTAEREDYWTARAWGGGMVYVAGAFGRGLEELLRDAMGQTKTFQLSYTPTEVPALVDVIYRDHRTEYVVEQDFVYDPETRSIEFLSVLPRADSVVRVIYETEDPVDPSTPTTGAGATEPTTAPTR